MPEYQFNMEGDDELLESNLPKLCRLCLKVDDDIVDIIDSSNGNSIKRQLSDRIYELYQIKVEKDDNLPTNICHKCLSATEMYADFRSNVRRCEARLQKFTLQLAIKGSDILPNFGVQIHRDDSRSDGLENFVPDENCIVIPIDPTQPFDESSDDDFSMMDSDNDEFPISNGAIELKLDSSIEAVVPEANTSHQQASRVEAINRETTEMTARLGFNCQYCEMAFMGNIECIEHEARHDAANPFVCHFCPFRTSIRQALVNHIKDLHGNNRPFICVLCSKGFCRRSDLRKHSTVHTGIRPFTCPVCAKSFSRNTNLTKHMRIHDSTQAHYCTKCPRTFASERDLSRHLIVHTLDKSFKCGKCDMSFTRKDRLLQHEETHHAVPTSTKVRPSMSMFPENTTLPVHPYIESQYSSQTIPSANAPGQLSQAAYQPDITPSLPITAPASRPLKLHICKVCSKTFTNRQELQRHQIAHTGEKPFACRFCTKKFNRRDKLARHERIHTDESKYSCNQCQLSFSKQEALDMHLKVHELERTSAMPTFPASAMPMQQAPLGMDPSAGFYNQQYQMPGQQYQQRSFGLGFYSELKPEDGF